MFFYISILFFKFINSFTPFIKKYFFENKSLSIIKSISGLLQHISHKNKKLLYCPVSIIEIETTQNCDFNLEKCKIKTIISGYMEHDPKKEASKKFLTNY